MFKKAFGFLGGVGSAVFVAVNILFALPAEANVLGVSGAPIVAISKVSDFTQLLCNIFDYMFLVLISVSVIMAIWAAFLYVTAEGEEEKLTKARRILTYVAVGVAVALLAVAVPKIVGNIFAVSLRSCS